MATQQANDPRVTALVETYAAQQASLTALLLNVLLNIWLPFRWWDRPEMVRAWVAKSSVEVDIVLTQVRRLSRTYAEQMLAEADALVRLPPIEHSYERGGTPINVVYERPARLFRYLEKVADDGMKDVETLAGAVERVESDNPLAGMDRDDLVDLFNPTPVKTGEIPPKPTKSPAEAFAERLEQIVAHDVAATARDEEQRVYKASGKVTGYRRVIHPEMSKTGTCGLCFVAANNFYTVGDLMPLHERCKCTTAPITATHDPAMNLSANDLKAVYDAAGGSTHGDDLKRTRVTVNQHGEYGPVLSREGDHFTDRNELNAERGLSLTAFEQQDKPRTTAMWAGMKAQSEIALKALRDARRDGAKTIKIGGREIPVHDIDTAINYHLTLITRAASYGA